MAVSAVDVKAVNISSHLAVSDITSWQRFSSIINGCREKRLRGFVLRVILNNIANAYEGTAGKAMITQGNYYTDCNRIILHNIYSS